VSIGLLALRLVVGLLFLGHASHKFFGSSHRIFGWVGGPGKKAAAEWMESMGLRPGVANVLAAGACEAVGGALLVVGLLTPLATLLLTAVMVTALLLVHIPRFWNTDNGVEFPLVMWTAAFTLGCTGPGRFSLDNAFDLRHFGWDWATGALGLGVVGSLAAIGAGRYVARQARTQTG
jgi:putative oxidoreductase